MTNTVPIHPLTGAQITSLAIRVAECLDGVAVAQAVAVLNEAGSLVLGCSVFRVSSPDFAAVQAHAPSSDEQRQPSRVNRGATA